MSELRGWYGFDLDGTLAKYEGWKGATHIGEPVPRMVERLKKMLAEGHECRIFTARVSGPTWANDAQDYARQREAELSRKSIEEWCLKHIGQVLPVTCMKDYGMHLLFDDRAKQVIPNTGELVEDLVAPR